MISRKVYHGANEKQALAVSNHTERLGMEDFQDIAISILIFIRVVIMEVG
jgi:hypothetical protein